MRLATKEENEIMIDVIFSGYSYQHDDGLIYDTDLGRAGFSSYQILFTHTPALFWVDEALREYPARSVILFTPGHRKYYSSLPGQPYKNDWIRFNTDEDFIEDFPIVNVPFSPADPDFIHNLFKLIAWESSNKTKLDQTIMQNLFKVLFDKMSEDYDEHVNKPYYHELMSLRREMKLHPELPWNVEDMAAYIKIGRTRFQNIYKEAFGISCIEDVIQSRIELAKDRLRYTTRSIAEIAEICGYKSTEHFCRQFAKETGLTPTHYRRSVP